MLHRRFLLIGLTAFLLGLAPGKASAIEAEKLVYISLKVSGGGDIVRSRIQKSALLKLSRVDGVHFLLLDDEGRVGSLPQQNSVYKLSLKVDVATQSGLVFELTDVKSGESLKRVGKEGFPRTKLLKLTDIALDLILSPLRRKKM